MTTEEEDRFVKLEERVRVLEMKQKVVRLPKIRLPKVSDAEWLEGLSKMLAYKHLNIPVEISKMDLWLALPKNSARSRTRAFVLNWLNRIPAPMQAGSVARPPAPPPKNDPIARGLWSRTYGNPKEYGYE